MGGSLLRAGLKAPGGLNSALQEFVKVFFWALSLAVVGAQPVTVQINSSQKLGQLKPVWRYFGYDEPNYTYGNNGTKLIHELAALSYEPVHIRTHFLLASGDGRPALKWGSTNVYTEDPSGKPIYDWTTVDRILSTYIDAGVTPFVEIGFMPKALSSHPEPYTPVWKPHGNWSDYYLGWTYPPKNDVKWGELVFQWVTHCVKRYGKSAVESWNWEVWNEPDIGYWHGTPEEYDKLYDFTAAAVKRALPSARIGGPASTGPANQKAAAFLRQFLEHCSSGSNYATGSTGAPLDFITFHAKGRPEAVEGHVRMGLSQELRDVSQGFEIVRSFAKFQQLPVILSEADPEGCAACSARVYPPNAYRNGTLYASYTAAAMKGMLELAEQNQVNLEGMLTWAFEFEGQPYFDGLRTLATNGIDKPVLNLFRMAGLMGGERVEVRTNGAIDALASRSDRQIAVMVWNYQEEDASGPAKNVDLRISGLPANERRVLLQHFRIDANHSNSYTSWKQMGSPQEPAPDQYRALEAAGQLQLLESPRWVDAPNGMTDVKFALPLQGVSLIELSW